MALFVDYGDCSGGVAVECVVGGVEGTGRRLECCGVYRQVLQECGGWNGVIIEAILLAFCRRMTSDDRNDLMPAQEKLEWVTPKISLLDAGEAAGAQKTFRGAECPNRYGTCNRASIGNS